MRGAAVSLLIVYSVDISVSVDLTNALSLTEGGMKL
jgi:hypothetical protein